MLDGMIDKRRMVAPITEHRFGRKLLLLAPLKLGKYLVRASRFRAARILLYVPGRLYPEDVRVMHLRAISAEEMGDHDTAAVLRAARLRKLVVPMVANKDFTGIFMIMAELERTRRPIQFKAGRMIAQQMVSPKGRATLLEAARKARKKFKQSAFLSHMISLCEAMDGDYRGASQRLVREIAAQEKSEGLLKPARLRMLQQSWRVVDLIARERMDWTEDLGEGQRMAVPGKQRSTPPAGATRATAGDASPPVPFKEAALQQRRRDEYLMLCDRDFARAEGITGQLAAITEMLRMGIRHMPDYHSSYELAGTRLREMAGELEELFSPESVSTLERAVRTVDDLCVWLRLARRLGMTDETARIIAHLELLSQDEKVTPALWPAPGVIAKDQRCEATAARIMALVERNTPVHNRDARDYFRWAAEANRYEAADAFYARMPAPLHRRHGLLYYANILQRQGRFKEALKVVTDVHGQMLASPGRLNAFSNHSLIKRQGELAFLIETERLYSSVKQPKNPEAVVLIAPRNIDQLRRYPLQVLLEFKRRGWAVVPLVEGLLPRELTGDMAIDVMNGAISATQRLSPKAKLVMPEPEDFVADPTTGSMRWGDMNLSHPVWEDAAINRRRYNIDWGCPELQHYLGGLMEWSRLTARVLSYAKAQHDLTGRKTACMSLFNSRIPDAVFRFFCEREGNPETFFFLHAANGYQNYFTNFATNISQRFVLRNMTRTPHVRSASFPVPAYYEAYYQENSARLPQIMERFAGITKVRRSTAGTKFRPEEAIQADARIAEWRARGGKVACAFGKVVCDSGVPYDGGPAHASMKDWINHTIRAVQGSDTLLLIKPHPHELNNEISTFPTEFFKDLIEEPVNENTLFMGHRWFDMDDMRERMDLGLVYNGTTAIELGLMGIPAVLAGYFAPVDYPIGHAVPKDRAEYAAYVRFEKPARVVPDIRERAAVWLDYMANEAFTQSYRYHARPVTNRVLYPPYWFTEDLKRMKDKGDPAVQELAGRGMNQRLEPGAAAAMKQERARRQAAAETVHPMPAARAKIMAKAFLRRWASLLTGRKAS